MAHIIPVPVGFVFNSRKARWIAGTINLRSWSRELGGHLTVSISSPPKYSGIRGTISANLLPNRTRRQLSSRNPLPVELKRTSIDVLLCLPIRDDQQEWQRHETVTIDPWECRREFLSVKKSTEDLLRFLNGYGAWSEKLAPHWGAGQWLPTIAFEARLRVQQEQIRESLKRTANEWFKGKVFEDLELKKRSEYPYYIHEDGFCFDAIVTSVTLDFLRRTRFRVCARKDCGNPFPADRKGKRYCQQYCAHLVSVRKGRKSVANHKGE